MLKHHYHYQFLSQSRPRLVALLVCLWIAAHRLTVRASGRLYGRWPSAYALRAALGLPAAWFGWSIRRTRPWDPTTGAGRALRSACPTSWVGELYPRT